tara:strand:+ start:1690 stop:1881 length:192 start_codon:yes stop_codon:yes gene_type:complete
VKFPTLQYLIRRYFRLPRKKLWIAALKLNRAPVIWWDEKVEAERNKEKLRQKRINSLYPNDKK